MASIYQEKLIISNSKKITDFLIELTINYLSTMSLFISKKFLNELKIILRFANGGKSQRSLKKRNEWIF